MSDKRDEDGFLYHGYRKVKTGGKIKVDNVFYGHEKLNNLIGEKVFIFNTGSYWSTEYTVYAYWAPFKSEQIICVINNLIIYNKNHYEKNNSINRQQL